MLTKAFPLRPLSLVKDFVIENLKTFYHCLQIAELGLDAYHFQNPRPHLTFQYCKIFYFFHLANNFLNSDSPKHSVTYVALASSSIFFSSVASPP